MNPRHCCWLLAVAVAIASQTGCTKKSRARGDLRRADVYFKASQYDQAEIEYLKALRLVPMNPESIRQLGLIYYAEGRMRSAYPFLEKSLEFEPQNADVRLKLGMVALGAGQLSKAHEQAVWVLDRDLGNEDALLLLAETSVSTKTLEDNGARIEFYRNQDRDRASYHVATGWLDLRQGDTNGADREFKAALALDPKSGTAHIGMADMCMIHEDAAGADKEFQQAVQCLPPRSSAILKYADFKLRNGAFDDGLKLLQDASKKTPDYIPLWVHLAEISLGQRRFDDCGRYSDQALARDPMNFEAMMLRAKLDLDRGDPAKSVADYDRIRQIYGAVPLVLYQQALAMLKSNDITRATDNLTQAVTLQTNYVDAILALAELHLEKGEGAAAQGTLTRVVTLQPGLERAQSLLAASLLEQHKTTEALAQYEQMSARFPNSPQTPVLEGVVLAQLGRLDEARASFERSLAITARDTNLPPNLQALQELLTLDVAEKHPDAALARVQRQIDLTPNLAELYAMRARIHMASSNYDTAEADLQKAIQLNPDLHDSYLLLARIYTRANQKQKALERLGQLVSRTNNIPALMQIGALHDALTNYNAERDTYETVLRVNPNFSPALNDLAYLYSDKLGQLDRAYELAEKAHQLSPLDPYTMDTLGWILFKRGDYARSLGLLDAAASRLGNEPAIQYHLAMAHYQLDNESRAAEAFQRCLASKREFPERDDAVSRLGFLAINPTNPPAESIPRIQSVLQTNAADAVLATRLGAYYERQGAAGKAAATYENAMAKLPDNAKIMVSLARLYGGPLGNPAKALELAKNAHNLAPDDPEASAVLGRLVLASADYNRALSLLQDAARQLPNDPAVQFDLAWASYNVGLAPDAAAAMERATRLGLSGLDAERARAFLTLVPASFEPPEKASLDGAEKIPPADPNYLPAQVALAVQRDHQGDTNGTQEIYKKILDQNPLFAPAARRLAILCVTSPGQCDEAKVLTCARTARDAFPNDTALARAIGILAYRQRDYSLGLGVLTDLASRQSDDAEVQFYLGMTQYQLKRSPESKASLKKALALHLAPGLTQEAQRVLHELN
jgi:tetratricopeptide (TPR) repeat protein